MTLDLRAAEARLAFYYGRNGNNCDEVVGELCDKGLALLAALRAHREALTERLDIPDVRMDERALILDRVQAVLATVTEGDRETT